MNIFKIQIYVAQNVGKLWISRKKNFPFPFGVISDHFLHGPNKSQKVLSAYFPWWGHGPYSPGLGMPQQSPQPHPALWVLRQGFSAISHQPTSSSKDPLQNDTSTWPKTGWIGPIGPPRKICVFFLHFYLDAGHLPGPRPSYLGLPPDKPSNPNLIPLATSPGINCVVSCDSLCSNHNECR